MMSVSSNFKFVLYKHGPYSFELSAHLQGLIADGLVCVLTRPPYGPTLGVGEQARSIAAKVERKGDVARHITFMSKKLSRKGVADLEKLATAVYVNKKFGLNVSIEKRAEIFTSLKPHVSVEAARSAFSEAKEIQEEVSGVFR
jgi:uncharacterized protein YwgA